ncbi:MAG TPA: flagellar biosynthesis regulator FlaF [Thiobacillaceae bacterium]|nr:flagellar biosynthesis regulator FlaF [Thiobacillaceae bacterium]
MTPEKWTPQAPRPVPCRAKTAREATRLSDIARNLMTVQRRWNDADRTHHLSAALQSSRAAWHSIQSALARGELALPSDVQHNMLILSVYAEHKIGACEADPSTAALGSLIALTRNLAGSLLGWREAA